MTAALLALVLAASPGAEGVRAWERGDVPRALSELREAVKQDARDVESHQALAVILAAQGELDEALAHCDAFLAVEASTSRALGVKELKAELAKEKQLGMSAVGLKVLRAEAHFAALVDAAAARDVARARRLWGHVVSLQPKQWEASALAGTLFLEEGHFGDAKRALELAAAGAPADARAPIAAALEFVSREVTYREQLKKGVDAFNKGDFSTAAATLEGACRLHPEAPEGVEEAVSALTKLGEWPRAMALVRAHVAKAEPGRVALPRAQIQRLERIADAYEKARTAQAPPATAPAFSDMTAELKAVDQQFAAVQADTARIQRDADARDARTQAEMSKLLQQISELEAEIDEIPSRIPELRERADETEAEAKSMASKAGGNLFGAMLSGGVGATAIALRNKADELERRLPRAQQELAQARARYDQLEASLQDKWEAKSTAGPAPSADDFEVEETPPTPTASPVPAAQVKPAAAPEEEAVASCVDARKVCQELRASSAAAIGAFNRQCLKERGRWSLTPCAATPGPRCVGAKMTAQGKTYAVNVLYPANFCAQFPNADLPRFCVEEHGGRTEGPTCGGSP